MESRIINTVGNGKGFIYFNPGGNWGNVYRHIMENRLKVWKMAFDNDIAFVSGPQSVYYQTTSKAALYDQRFIKFVGSQKDLITFRQHDSYEYSLLQYGNFTNVKECPDMTFMLGSQTPTSSAAFDVFLLMRRDSESQFGRPALMHDAICSGIAEAGFTCAVGDWGSGTSDIQRENEVGATFADLGIESAIETISLGQLIITDRLHGAVFAFLSGKSVIYVDNTYDKISQSLSTAFGFASSCSNEEKMGVFEISEDVDDVVSYVVKYLKKHGKTIEYEESKDKVEASNGK